MGAVGLPKILVLTIDAFVSAQWVIAIDPDSDWVAPPDAAGAPGGAQPEPERSSPRLGCANSGSCFLDDGFHGTPRDEKARVGSARGSPAFGSAVCKRVLWRRDLWRRFLLSPRLVLRCYNA